MSDDTLYVVNPKGHPILRARTLEPVDISNYPMILGDMSEWGEYRYRLEDMFGQLGITLKPDLEASNTLALIGLVAAGLGITVYPESLIGYLGNNVKVRPLHHSLFRIKTVMVWRRTNHGRAVTNFVAMAKHRRVER